MILARNIGKRNERLVVIHSTCRVVRVDHEQRLGVLGRLRLDVVDIGVPMVVQIATVEDRLAAGQVGGVAPKRIARRGQKYLVARADKSAHKHRRRFAHAIADENIIGRDALQPAPDVVGADDVAGILHAAHVSVRYRLVDVQCQRLTHRVRQKEPESPRVAGIQF